MPVRTGVLLVSLVAACSSSWAHPPITSQVTWNREVVRIFRTSCTGCHHSGGEAFSLVRYEEARAWARAIAEEVLERRMPPWPAARGVGDLADDPSLSPSVIALIVSWANGGTPEGDVADAPTDAPSGDARTATRPPSLAGRRRLEVRRQESIARPAAIVAIAPHAEPGESIEVWVRTPAGGRDEVVYIPRFDHERTYGLNRALSLARGATVEVVGGRGATLWLSEDTRRPSPRPRR